MKLSIIAVCLAFVLFHQASGKYIKAVFSSQNGHDKGIKGRLTSSSAFPSLKQMTICHWINTEKLRPKGEYALTYVVGNTISLATGVRHDPKSFLFKIGDTTAKISNPKYNNEEHFPINVWQHLCFTWSSGKGNAEVFTNGKLYGKATVATGRTIPQGGKLVMGRNKVDPSKTWDGSITDVQIWDEVLPAKQIAAMAKCEEQLGNVFSWLRNPLIAEDRVTFALSTVCHE